MRHVLTILFLVIVAAGLLAIFFTLASTQNLNTNPGYLQHLLFELWQMPFIRWFIGMLILTLFIVIIGWGLMYRPLLILAHSMKQPASIKKWNSFPFSALPIFKPLTTEIEKLQRNLARAQRAAREEAKATLERIDSPWTAERLSAFVKDILKNRTIIVVSNREPYVHIQDGAEIKIQMPASGMVTAVEPLMEACRGTWIAQGTGSADRITVNAHDEVMVPPDDPKYMLKRVWLTQEEQSRYYDGFCNEGLWPLCHLAHTRPIFRKEDWDEYQKVNKKFAEAVLQKIKRTQQPVILIQDFHFALLPRYIQESRPDATIGIFWHIPWVSAESFSICPWKREILDGMLGADIVGFHTQLHCNNFIESVSRELESLIDFEHFTITRHGHTSLIKPFPISIAFTNDDEMESTDHVDELSNQQALKNLGIASKYVGIGVDRLDYTKGILERFKAIEIFLEHYADYVGKFTFIQIGAPTREGVDRYRQFAHEVKAEADRINLRFRTKSWQPIIFLQKHHSHDDIYRYYRLADVCLVTSLHDGMNLVAKEFIAARNDNRGVLILSQFTGASRELTDSLLVNPYNAEQTAEMIKTALEMPIKEQAHRMQKLRQTVKDHNVYRWSAEFLKALVQST